MTHGYAETAGPAWSRGDAAPDGGAGDQVFGSHVRTQQIDPPGYTAGDEGIGGRRLEEIERDDVVLVFIGIKLVAHGHLVKVADAPDGAAFLLGSRQRRQEHRGEDGDNGDDDQQFNEGERRAGAPIGLKAATPKACWGGEQLLCARSHRRA